MEWKDIENRSDLASFLNIPLRKLTYTLYAKKTENLYTSFEVPKKSGDIRIIDAPTNDLKEIQKKLTKKLYEHREQAFLIKGMKTNISHGFEKKKTIITNAKIHRNKRFIYNIDLLNFFESFHFGRVKGYFEKNRGLKLKSEIATIIAQLTCYKGYLPQGAPSSPIITNMICSILDYRLLKLSKKYKLDFTRYVDDLTFSTNRKDFPSVEKQFYEEVIKEIENAGFCINTKKTNLMYRASKQKVTGLIVNKKINIERTYYKKTRSMVYNLFKNEEFHINGTQGTLNQLEGRLTFMNQIDWYNNKIHPLDKRSAREKLYRDFLFYKQFIINEKPVIITEGKTDILYLKAALSNLYLFYPNLVSKKSDGTFEYKVTFFNKSKRFVHLFDISQDGGDALTHFIIKNIQQKNSLYHKFDEKVALPDKQPVIFLYDNETKEKKPLKKLINNKDFKIDQLKKASIKEQYNVEIFKKVYILTNPLVKNREECEIEDLFEDKLLNVEISGKKFDKFIGRKGKDTYGKHIFSRHIVKNYLNINFENFKPMLDSLNLIVTNQK